MALKSQIATVIDFKSLLTSRKQGTNTVSTLKLMQIGSRGAGSRGRGKELKTNHLYQIFCEMV